MRFACWITKATDRHTHTHTEYAILKATLVTRPYVTLYANCLVVVDFM